MEGLRSKPLRSQSCLFYKVFLDNQFVQRKGLRKKHFVVVSIRIKREMLQIDIRFEKVSYIIQPNDNYTFTSPWAVNEQQIFVLCDTKNLNKCVLYLTLYAFLHLCSETSTSSFLRLPEKVDLKKDLLFAPKC